MSAHFWGVRASRLESAAFVVARSGRTPLLPPCTLLAPLAEAGACSRCLPHLFADERHVCSLARPGQRRASLAPCGGARSSDAHAPHFWGVRASHVESAAVVARRGRTPLLTPRTLLAPLAEAGACSRCLPHSFADERHVCSLARPGQRRQPGSVRGRAIFRRSRPRNRRQRRRPKATTATRPRMKNLEQCPRRRAVVQATDRRHRRVRWHVATGLQRCGGRADTSVARTGN